MTRSKENAKKKKKQSVATLSPKRKGEEQGTRMTETETTRYNGQSRQK